jgi:hypothetical protein
MAYKDDRALVARNEMATVSDFFNLYSNSRTDLEGHFLGCGHERKSSADNFAQE